MILSPFNILSFGDRYCRFKMFVVYFEFPHAHHRKHLMFSFALLFRIKSVKVLLTQYNAEICWISEYFIQSSHLILQS